ncbi:MAG TPA: hypothetical protein ENJ84_02100 [Gammaproteobacteria bacterium]|nr:hypothetical protein [Gammaproteobacteria bacterium]
MKKMILGFAVSTTLSLSAAAQASDFDIALATKASSLGAGFELLVPVSQKFNIRAGLNKFDYSLTQVIDEIEYTGDLALNSFSLNSDWHPFSGGFRLSGGLVLNKNEVRGTATPDADITFTIGDTDYSSKDIQANATIDFNDVAPYLGLGYDRVSRNKKGLGFTAELGVLFQGSPQIDLTVSGSDTVNGIIDQTTLQSDIDKELVSIEDDVSAYNIYPVVALGLTYQF